MAENCNSVGVPEIDSLVKFWMKFDRNEKTRAAVENLVAEKNVEKLRSIMCERLSFGTAGMRAKMEAGFNRLNDLVIIQTTQGMVRYLEKTCPSLKDHGIVVGYDARYNSERFAHLVANIFLRSGVKVYLYSKIVPTPFVSYAIVQYGCDAGVMVTASHNPGEDNGYKAYWKNGAQILSPHDKGICEEAAKNSEPWEGSWDISFVNGSPLRIDPTEDLFRRYSDDSKRFCHYRSDNSNTTLKLTYTPFHGVGYYYTPKLLVDVFGFREENIVYVEEQKLPDPDFPTVKFPNPEEGEHVLALSFKAADAANSTLIIANDPDADRLQLAEKRDDSTWRVFTGNEMGGLLAWWQWHCWRLDNPTASGSSVYMINSVVSSKIVQSIAAKEGFNYVETLTGFKWMGNRAEQLRSEGKTVLLAWEESIGYMPGNTLDKDGVLTAALFAEYAAHLRKKGSNLAGQLKFLYETYGYHLGFISYFINYDANVTEKMFSRLRNYDGHGYPAKLGRYSIRNVRDLTVGYDDSQPDKKPILPVSKSVEMITFTLEGGSVVTLRTSGTEPKIKYYIEVITKPDSGHGLEEAEEQLRHLIDCTVKDLIRPDVYGLKGKDD